MFAKIQNQKALESKSQDNQNITNLGTVNKAKDLLNKFVDSVNVLVKDITTLEVNTIVVSNISGSKFNPWQAYYNIYAISDPNYFTDKQIVLDLQERYINIFLQLEREYIYILLEQELEYKESGKPDGGVIDIYNKRLRYIDENRLNADGKKESKSMLPSPFGDHENNVDNYQKISKILSNNKFVLTLRKVSELKAALDGGDITSDQVDTIYAQTIMQLDGDIITRYHRDLFNLKETDQDIVMKIHNDGVVSGEKQWRETIEFLINFVKNIAGLSSGKI